MIYFKTFLHCTLTLYKAFSVAGCDQVLLKTLITKASLIAEPQYVYVF